jgi:hypothetical protein
VFSFKVLTRQADALVSQGAVAPHFGVPLGVAYPRFFIGIHKAGTTGFEPAISCVTGRRFEPD